MFTVLSPCSLPSGQISPTVCLCLFQALYACSAGTQPRLYTLYPSAFVSRHLLSLSSMSLIIVYWPIKEECWKKKTIIIKWSEGERGKGQDGSVSDCVVIRFWHFVLTRRLFVTTQGRLKAVCHQGEIKAACTYKHTHSSWHASFAVFVRTLAWC